MSENPYKIWASVEVMGHSIRHGYVELYETYGEPPDVNWISVKVPQRDGGMKKYYYNPQAIFSITPTTEEEVRHILCLDRPEPDGNLPF